VLGSASTSNIPAPVFPGKAGVADTFAWLGHFAPIALIVAVAELIFPLTLWLTTVFGLRARMLQAETGPDRPRPRSRKTGK